MASGTIPPIGLAREWKWSGAEKAAARRAFNKALTSEMQATLLEAKQRASRMTQADDLWSLERWIAKRRERIDSAFDYRYSMLPFVFARLIADGRLTVEDLEGIHAEKIASIEMYVAFLKER